MTDSWIHELPDAFKQEIYNLNRKASQVIALKQDEQEDEDFLKATISDPFRDVFEHQDMKALCMTLTGCENSMMDMTLDHEESSKMDFTMIAPDETLIHVKEYVDEALKGNSKMYTDALSKEQKELGALLKELDEYDDMLDIEIEAAEREDEDSDEYTNDEDESLVEDEECCLLRDKIDEVNNQLETCTHSVIKLEESDIILEEEEIKKLKLSLDDNKQQQSTLKNLIERLEEETVLMASQVSLQAQARSNQRQHLPQGNSMFAEYDDRRLIINQKNEKLKAAIKEIMLSKNKWDVKLKNLKSENTKLIEKLKDDKSWISQIDSSGSKYEKLLTLFETFKELIKCIPLEYRKFEFDEELKTELKGFLEQVLNRSQGELQEKRNQSLEHFRMLVSDTQSIVMSKNVLVQINYQINMEKLKTKSLTAELEEGKIIQQAEEKQKEEEVKPRVVTFNVPEEEEGKAKEKVVEKKKPAFKWVKAKKIDLSKILNT